MTPVAVASPAIDGSEPPLLEARQLTVGYSGLPAVRDLDLVVRRGEIVALLGANGAGKTSTILGLAGELRPMSGSVWMGGQRCRSSLSKRARDGLALVTEEKSVFMRLTTAENLRLGRGDPETALQMFPLLREHLSRKAGLLSGGQQQILTLARALASSPEVLLADELSLGLAPIIVRQLLTALRAAADERGVGVLLVEQHAQKALDVADRAYVLQRGRCVLSGTAAELREQFALIERSYLSGPGTQEDA
jgi:branched-chain amino acid transport system ATP-binding protein